MQVKTNPSTIIQVNVNINPGNMGKSPFSFEAIILQKNKTKNNPVRGNENVIQLDTLLK